MRGTRAKALRRIANKVGLEGVYEGQRQYSVVGRTLLAVGTYGFYKHLKKEYYLWRQRRDEPIRP